MKADPLVPLVPPEDPPAEAPAFSIGPAQPWCTFDPEDASTDDDMLCCDKVDLTDVTARRRLAAYIEVASSLLYQLSHRRFPGTVTAREWLCVHQAPCGSPAIGWCGECMGGMTRSYPLPTGTGTWINCSPCSGRSSCECTSTRRFRLPFQPVIAVTSLEIDGVVVDPDDYKLVDGWIYLCNVELPTCVDICNSKGLVGEWTWGMALPAEARLAACSYACELLKAKLGKPCALPRRVTQVVRSGVSWSLTDPLKFLDEGKLGVTEADTFLAVWGQAPAGVIFPEDVEPLDFSATARNQW